MEATSNAVDVAYTAGMMGDLAHALQLPWRSLSDQQELVIKGKFGEQASKSKPFDSLRVSELRQE